VTGPRFDQLPWPSPDSGDEPSSEACAQLVDLLYALGDLVAERYHRKIKRYYRRRHRKDQPAAVAKPDGVQLDLFPADLLEPF